jgi:hypothetical protein
MKVSMNFKLIGISILLIVGLTACKKEESLMDSYVNQQKQTQNNPQQTASTPSVNETYEAIFTCGLNSSQNLNILACFSGSNGADTELEIQNGEQYGMYKAYNLSSIGNEDQQGFHISLKNHFSIKAQNSNENLILSLKIMDSTGKIVFQKSAAHYGVISVKN